MSGASLRGRQMEALASFKTRAGYIPSHLRWLDAAMGGTEP